MLIRNRSGVSFCFCAMSDANRRQCRDARPVRPYKIRLNCGLSRTFEPSVPTYEHRQINNQLLWVCNPQLYIFEYVRVTNPHGLKDYKSYRTICRDIVADARAVRPYPTQ